MTHKYCRAGSELDAAFHTKGVSMKPTPPNDRPGLLNRIIRLSIWIVLEWFSLLVKILTGITNIVLGLLKKLALGGKENDPNKT